MLHNTLAVDLDDSGKSYMCAQLLSHVGLFMTPQTIACQAPLSMDSSGKNTGVGCHFRLQGIFPTQGLNPGLPHCRQILYQLSHKGSHRELY